jgi:hypothetical protein
MIKSYKYKKILQLCVRLGKSCLVGSAPGGQRRRLQQLLEMVLAAGDRRKRVRHRIGHPAQQGPML